MLLYCNVNEISRLTLKLAYAGAQDGQTIRVSVANREVFVTFRVRTKKTFCLFLLFAGKHH